MSLSRANLLVNRNQPSDVHKNFILYVDMETRVHSFLAVNITQHKPPKPLSIKSLNKKTAKIRAQLLNIRNVIMACFFL